jgi:glycosyltransferase involved in cell wall biosynthesis
VVHLHWLADAFVADESAVTAAAGTRLIAELCTLRARGVGVVWTVHNVAEHERRSPRVERAVKGVVARLADALVVHADVSKGAVVDTFGLSGRHRRKVVTVPHGHYRDSYPDEIGREAARESLGYEDETVFLSFGRIRAYKNVPALIDTFRGLDAPDARLLVVGNPHDDRLAGAVRRRAVGDSRVRTVLEYVPRAEVGRYMNAADAVVLAYDGAFASGAAVLGMSFGRAVVAPDCGYVGELLDPEGAVRYDPDSPDGLERALAAALDADLASMGEHNRRLIGRFAWPEIARRTRAVYEAALAGTTPPAAASEDATADRLTRHREVAGGAGPAEEERDGWPPG